MSDLHLLAETDFIKGQTMLAPSSYATVRRPRSAIDLTNIRPSSLTAPRINESHLATSTPSISYCDCNISTQSNVNWNSDTDFPKMRNGSTTSYGEKLACEYLESGSVLNGSLSSSTSTTPLSSRSGSPLPPSPDVHQKHWYHKLHKMKDEIDRIGGGFRQARVNIRTSIDGLLVRMNQVNDTTESLYAVSGGTRFGGAKVEIVRNVTTSKKSRRFFTSPHRSDKNKEEASFESSEHNFSMFLMLTSLQDGIFRAELPMDKLPPGNVRIQVRNYTLEIVVTEIDSSTAQKDDEEESLEKEPHINQNETSCNQSMQNGKSTNHASTQSKPLNRTYCGSISIPIFVNSSTLEFELNEEGTVLHVTGRLKGCSNKRRLSLSANDLRISSPPSNRNRLEVPEYFSRNSSTSSLNNP